MLRSIWSRYLRAVVLNSTVEADVYFHVFYMFVAADQIHVLFQNTFEQVRYSVIGDDSAPVYFAVNQFTGAITVKASLSSDTETSYYVRIYISITFLYNQFQLQQDNMLSVA